MELIEGPDNLPMNSLSHKIAVVRRDKIEDFWSTTLVTPITDHIRSRLALAMRNQNIRQQVELFELFNSLASSKALSGIFFENICHKQFQRQIRIKYVPMVRLQDNERRGNPQWHSSHYTIENGQLEQQRRSALDRVKSLDLVPSGCHEYGIEPFSLKENVYYIPMISNEVAFESFISYDGHLYIFQFTVSKNYDIKEGIIPRIPDLIGELPPREKWRFIFIIPADGETLKCPYSKCPGFQGLELYSSELVMKDFIQSMLSLEPPQAPQPMRNSPPSLKDEENEGDEEDEHPRPEKKPRRSGPLENPEEEKGKGKGGGKGKGKARQN